MNVYARIDRSANPYVILEIIDPAVNDRGEEIPITERFTPEFVDALVDITAATPRPEWGWTATELDGAWIFEPPGASGG